MHPKLGFLPPVTSAPSVRATHKGALDHTVHILSTPLSPDSVLCWANDIESANLQGILYQRTSLCVSSFFFSRAMDAEPTEWSGWPTPGVAFQSDEIHTQGPWQLQVGMYIRT